MRLIWGRILASLAKALTRTTFSKWHILDHTILLLSASQGKKCTCQVFLSFFHALHSNGTWVTNSCLHEADTLPKIKTLLRCIGGEFNNCPEQCKKLQGLETPYLILTIKHSVMLRLGLPFSHTRTREKKCQQDQCIFTDNKSSQPRIQTGALSRDICKSLQLFQDTKCLEWWPEVKVALLWCSSAVVRPRSVHHLGRHSWQDSYGDIAS